jgi:hypothetical protein
MLEKSLHTNRACMWKLTRDKEMYTRCFKKWRKKIADLINLTLRKYCVSLLTRFIWLRIGTSAGFLWTRQWTFEISWPAQRLSDSQDKLCSVDSRLCTMLHNSEGHSCFKRSPDTGDSRYTRFRYPRLRISSVLSVLHGASTAYPRPNLKNLSPERTSSRLVTEFWRQFIIKMATLIRFPFYAFSIHVTPCSEHFI